MYTIISILTVTGVIANCQDVSLAFPERPGQRIDSEKKFERVPLYAPDKCPGNQLLYPGDQKSDWICDCGPGYIYYPPKDECFSAYRRGPCARGYHLILPKHKVVPECVLNPCREGYAKYRGKCYEMGKPNGPCDPIELGGGIFDVNATTLTVECLIGTEPLSLFNVPPNIKKCPPGGKRDAQHVCRESWNVSPDDNSR